MFAPHRRMLAAVCGVLLATTCAAGNPNASKSAISRASALIGDPLENEQGWRIGMVDDFLVDPSDGRLAFAIVRAGSRFEAPTDLLALPLPDPKVTTADGNLRTELEFRALKRLSPVSSALEELPADERGRLVSLKALMDASLVDARGSDLGDVDDAVLDIQAAKLKYLIANYDTSWMASGKEVAVAPTHVKREGDGLAVVADPAKLQSAAEFDPASKGLPRDSFLNKAMDFAGLR